MRQSLRIVFQWYLGSALRIAGSDVKRRHLELEGHIKTKHLELYELLVVPPDHQFFEKLFHCKPSILGYPPFIHILVPPGSVFPYVGVSVDGLLVQIHVEVPALAGLKVWMLFLQFYVLFVLFLCIQTAIGAGSCFGFGWALGHEQHLLLFLLLFLLFFPVVFSVKGCWCNFMWRCLLCQFWMLLLQFYVLLVLVPCI